jgi:hypothetical protein
MKCFLLLALAASGLLSTAAAQAPGGMRQVYLMPMAGGLDQYLAAQLTREHVLQVVTDPKVADVIMTDRIGEAFEQKMAELFPPAKPDDTDEKKDGKTDDKTAGAATQNSFRTTAARGTVFLVDTKSRQVVWSDHEKPVDPTDRQLSREAERIVKKLAPQPAK